MNSACRTGKWVPVRLGDSIQPSAEAENDSAEFGAGALYRLTDLTIDDTIRVTVAGGGIVTYQVNERRIYDKAIGLPAAIFGTDGAPRLVPITCGGAFDKATPSYESNIAVFASPN